MRTKGIKLSQGTIGKSNPKYAGMHLIADFWDGDIIESKKEIGKILIEAAKRARSTPLKLVIHKFKPQGLAGILLLKESHISIHTWPEIRYMAVDIFTCGAKTQCHQALGYLKETLQPKKVILTKLKRGLM